MMNNFYTFGSMGFGFLFYKIFAFITLIGLIFFIAWALKNLKKEQLFNWAVILLITGIIGWLLTASMRGWHHGYGNNTGFYPPMMRGYYECDQDEECHSKMEEFMERMMNLEK